MGIGHSHVINISHRNQRISFGKLFMGDNILKQEHYNQLYLELASWEDRGITIWLDGSPSNSKQVSAHVSINESNTYMRDYIFSEGVLKEIHFDKIDKQQET